MHHFSSFNNPIYRRVVTAEIGTGDEQKLRFCAGCHDPVLRAADELNPLDLDSWSANAGITCLSCHRITEVGAGNGEYILEEPLLHPFALAQHESLRKTHEVLLQLTPWLHRQVMSKPLYKTPQFCASCHTLRVPAEINGHSELTLMDEYQQWQASHYAGNDHAVGQRICQDCHMPLVPAAEDPAAKNGLVRSHSFAAGNTALPLLNRDLEHLQKAEHFLASGIVALQLTGLRRKGEEIFQDPKSFGDVSGEDTLELRLAVINRGVGHHFPAGTADSNEAWLALQVIDADGQLLANQGQLDARGQLPLEALRFAAHFVDKAGAPTSRRTTTTRAVKLQESNLIAAGGQRELMLVIPLPNRFRAPLTINLVLNWRKYDPEFINWVFEGRQIPELPVTRMAELTVTLPLVKSTASHQTHQPTEILHD